MKEMNKKKNDKRNADSGKNQANGKEFKVFRELREHLTQLLQVELDREETSRGTDAEERIGRMADTLLRDALREGASDIHLDPLSDAVQIRFRIDGVLHDTRTLNPEQGERLARYYKASAGLDPVTAFQPEDASYTYPLEERQVDLRIACAPTMCGEKLTIRLLEHRRIVQQIDDLGLSEESHGQLRQWLSATTGMFLVTGPTGSGKTTTLYTLLHQLKLLDRSVVTIEDPVEYQIDGIVQIQVDEDHGLTFLEGLKTVLRLDPDYLLIGEIRDADSARAALEAAASGRALMSTLHSRDAVGALLSLRQWGLQDHEIAAVLEIVVAQRLVRRLCEHCRQADSPTEWERDWLEQFGGGDIDRIWRSAGCEACHGIGYAGRTGVFEVWRLDPEDRRRILEHENEDSLRQSVAERGVPPLFADGLNKVRQGVTSLEEFRSMALQGPSVAARIPEQARSGST